MVDPLFPSICSVNFSLLRKVSQRRGANQGFIHSYENKVKLQNSKQIIE